MIYSATQALQKAFLLLSETLKPRSFWGRCPWLPQGALPLDPAGGLGGPLDPRPLDALLALLATLTCSSFGFSNVGKYAYRVMHLYANEIYACDKRHAMILVSWIKTFIFIRGAIIQMKSVK